MLLQPYHNTFLHDFTDVKQEHEEMKQDGGRISERSVIYAARNISGNNDTISIYKQYSLNVGIREVSI